MQSELHYRNKTRYNFGKVPDYCLLHASIYANSIYTIINDIREELLDNWKIKVLHVRNVKHCCLIRLELAERLINQKNILHEIIDKITSNDEKMYLIGFWLTIYGSEAELIYGDEKIVDYIDTDFGRINIVSCIDSFATLNPATMIPTYSWFANIVMKNCIAAPKILIIGRDIIRPGYYLANAISDSKVTCFSECPVIMADAVQSAGLNTKFRQPIFASYIENQLLETDYDLVIYNGRDYNKYCQQFVDNNYLKVDGLIIVSCKAATIPNINPKQWKLGAEMEINQQPGVTHITQKMFYYSKSRQD